MVKIMLLLLERCHYIRHGCWSCVTLRYACLYIQFCQAFMLSSFIQIHAFVRCFSARVLRLQVRCRSHGFVKLVCYHPGRELEYIKFWVMQTGASLGCYKDDVCYSKISKNSICMQIPGVCRSQRKFSYIIFNKLPFWRPFFQHSPSFFLFC